MFLHALVGALSWWNPIVVGSGALPACVGPRLRLGPIVEWDVLLKPNISILDMIMVWLQHQQLEMKKLQIL